MADLADWSGREQMSVFGLQGLLSLLLLILGLEKGFWMENQGLFAAGPFALRPPPPTWETAPPGRAVRGVGILALACVLCHGYNDEQGIMCPSSNSSLARDVLANKALVGLDWCPRGRETEKLAGRGSWGRMQRLFLENVCAIPSLPCPSATLDLSCKNRETIVFAAPPLLRV